MPPNPSVGKAVPGKAVPLSKLVSTGIPVEPSNGSEENAGEAIPKSSGNDWPIEPIE